MKYCSAFIWVLLLFLIGASSQAQIPYDLLTTAEKTNYDSTSKSDEVVQFLKAAAKYSNYLHLDTMFTTSSGRTAYYAILSKEGVVTPEEALATAKPIVYLQGNIHAGEVEAKEALMLLIRDIILENKSYLLENQIVLIAPNFNPDGNDKMSDKHRSSQEHCPHRVGTRRSGGDFDLNRDGVKAEAVETRGFFNNIINKWDPMLVVDMHTTNGTWHGNALTYAHSYHTAGHPATSQYTKNQLLTSVQQQMKSVHELNTHGYGNYYFGEGWPPQKYYTYNHHPRYLVNQFGLRNRMAILSETFAHDKFYQRIQSAYSFALEILEFTHLNGYKMLEVNNKATEASIQQIQQNAGQFKRGVQFKMIADTTPFQLLTYDYVSYIDSLGKSQYYRQPNLVRIADVQYYCLFEPTLLSTVPQGYHIPSDMLKVVQQLQLLGVRVRQLEKDTVLKGEAFTIQSLKFEDSTFEHHNMLSLEGGFKKATNKAKAGDYLVEMRQNLAYLIFYLLEPQSDDGLVRWNFFDKYFHEAGAPDKKVRYPVFKYW